MPQGFEVMDTAGTKVLVSSDVLTFAVKQSGTATTVAGPGGAFTYSSYGDVPVDVSGMESPLIGIQCVNGMAFVGLSSGKPRFVSSAPAGTTFTWFIFTLVKDIADPHVGIETYDAAGVRSFSSGQRMMKPVATMVSTGGFGAGNAVERLGKSLAVVNMSWAGTKTWPDSGLCFDTQPATAWEPGQGCGDLRINQNYKAYGARVVNSNQRAEFESISFSDIQITTTPAGHAANVNHSVPLRAVVVDVTGIPVPGAFY